MSLEKKLPKLSFQSFHISKEYSSCHLIPDVIDFVKRLEEIADLTISHRFGRRVLINSNEANLKEISRKNFLEIVDYNPFKKILLVMGAEERCIDSPLHWYMHHARQDVNTVLLIKDKKYIKENKDKIPCIDNKYPIWTIEQIKKILRALRNSKIVIIKNVGVLFVGDSLKEVENQFSKYKEKIK
jgi:hypothetical protein